MSRQLVESVLSGNMLEANDMVEARLAEIREKKMYEMKRMYAAESVGGLTKAEIEARRKAGYKKASEVLGDPRKGTTSIPGHTFKKVKKKVVEESLDEDTMANVVKMMNTLRSKGIRGRIGRATLKRVRGRESTYDPLKQAERKKEKEKETEYQRPGMLKRNVNTLMGREPDYKSEPSKGGRVGKVVRGAVVGVKRGLEMLGQTGGGVV